MGSTLLGVATGVLVVTAQDATLVRANLIQPDHVPEGPCRIKVGSAVAVVTAPLHLPCLSTPLCRRQTQYAGQHVKAIYCHNTGRTDTKSLQLRLTNTGPLARWATRRAKHSATKRSYLPWGILDIFYATYLLSALYSKNLRPGDVSSTMEDGDKELNDLFPFPRGSTTRDRQVCTVLDEPCTTGGRHRNSSKDYNTPGVMGLPTRHLDPRF